MIDMLLLTMHIAQCELHVEEPVVYKYYGLQHEDVIKIQMIEGFIESMV